MASRIDSADLLYQYLSSDAGIAAEVGANLYGPPGLKTNFTLAKAIAFFGDGGPGNPDVPMAEERFVFHCYGETQKEAREVFAALHDALHRAGRSAVSLGGGTAVLRRADLEMGPADIPEPETGWPRVVCAFRVIFTEWKLA